MTELGTRLKEARVAKGFSLDDLQEITKIQKRYLVGIEEGNYSIMPGSFYVRAFIKQYAEAVGLDADEILAEYKQDVPGTQTEEVAQSFTQSPSRRKLASSSSNRMMEMMPKIIVALFIIVIIIVIWTLYLQKAKNTPDIVDDTSSEIQYDKTEDPVKEENKNDVAADEEEDADTAEKEEPVEEPKQVIGDGQIQPDGATTIFDVAGTDTLNIRVEVAGPSWVGIRNEKGDEQVEAKVYDAGNVVEHDSTANSYARIRLGNSQVAKVFVNDEELQYAQNAVAQNIVLRLVKEVE